MWFEFLENVVIPHKISRRCCHKTKWNTNGKPDGNNQPRQILVGFWQAFVLRNVGRFTRNHCIHTRFRGVALPILNSSHVRSPRPCSWDPHGLFRSREKILRKNLQKLHRLLPKQPHKICTSALAESSQKPLDKDPAKDLSLGKESWHDSLHGSLGANRKNPVQQPFEGAQDFVQVPRRELYAIPNKDNFQATPKISRNLGGIYQICSRGCPVGFNHMSETRNLQ